MSTTNILGPPDRPGKRVLPYPDSSIGIGSGQGCIGWSVTCDTSYVIEGDSSGPHPLPPDADQSLMAAVLQKVLSCRANLSDVLKEDLVRVSEAWCSLSSFALS